MSFNMSEDDIRLFMRQPWTMTSSDGDLSLPGPGRPHPRNYGAIARKLAVYVRERKVQSIEDAIRAMTSLPARVWTSRSRGVTPRAIADLVVFDPATIQDHATHERPFAVATGMAWVVVNGQVAIADGANGCARR